MKTLIETALRMILIYVYLLMVCHLYSTPQNILSPVEKTEQCTSLLYINKYSTHSGQEVANRDQIHYHQF